MYEYAATAIAPNISGANAEAIKIEVGPSAPPIILIAEHCFMVKSTTPVYCESAAAPTSEPKIPNCAAPPSSAVLGLARSGPKSVIAPTPIKMRRGKNSF